jgi:hypothetical protein
MIQDQVLRWRRGYAACALHFIPFQGSSAMPKTAFLLALAITALASLPAQAQLVFVSAHGLDTNPCTVTQPCRTFQQAYNIAPANSEIDVLDPAGYGPVLIEHGISIQALVLAGSADSAVPVPPSPLSLASRCR